MNREYEIFTKRVKNVILSYAVVTTIFNSGLTDNIYNYVSGRFKNKPEKRNIECAIELATTRDKLINSVVSYQEDIENKISEDNLEVEDVIDNIPQEENVVEPAIEEVVPEEVPQNIAENNVQVCNVEDTTITSSFSEDEIYLMAKVCLAEAEGESEYGQRLVISTILNRLDASYYPDSIYDVVYQPYQFEVMDNGRIDRVTVTDETLNLVREEIANRTNYDVIYFRMDCYSEYGTPLFKEGCHYFSSF